MRPRSVSGRSFRLLVNPLSGGGSAPAAAAPVARLLRDAGARVEVTESTGPVACADLAREVAARGDVVVAVGGDGIIMVDSQFAALSDKIKAAIRAISPLPVRYLVNTHFHGDHTGGNESFARDGVVVVAHDNIRVRLAAGTANALTGVKAAPRPPEALPRQTYLGGSLDLEVGGRTARLTHVAKPTPTATRGSISPTPTCSSSCPS